MYMFQYAESAYYSFENIPSEHNSKTYLNSVFRFKIKTTNTDN